MKFFKQEKTAKAELKFASKMKGEPFFATPIQAFMVDNGIEPEKDSICIAYKFAQHGDLYCHLKNQGPLPTPVMKLYVH